MDPADQWLVYDEVAGVPAERDGKILVGLSREAAERLALVCRQSLAHADDEGTELVSASLVRLQRL